MSPITALLPSYVPHFNYARNTATDFQSQWRNPSDILSLLLVLGPDVIWRALAQLSGERITPVVFSYGWVAFAVNALVAAYGGKLMGLSLCTNGAENFLQNERWPNHAPA